jgi:DNA mismatch repair ATPase MutS
MGQRSIGNDARAKGRNPVIITGVNEGGKSTFLRSVGVAQLMMQCGLFVPAESFSADIAMGVFTHYRRKEDRSMTSGKFDEELVRMDAIVDHITPYSLILFNESFAATNEREGAEIAGQITRALIDHTIRVLFVTHLYSFAVSYTGTSAYNPLLLRAERQPDGARTFKIVEGPPSDRSHGEDLYRKVFGDNERDDMDFDPA